MVDKYKVVFVRDVSGIPQKVGQKRVWATWEYVRFKKKTYKFDIKKPTYRVKTWNIYIYDVEKGQIQFGSNENIISPVMLHEIVTNELARQLVAGLENILLNANIIIMILLGAGMAFAVGYLVGNFAPMNPPAPVAP